MNRFDYVRAGSVAEAVAAGAAAQSAYLAAGTNLLDLMKGGISRPTQIVDITRLPGLNAVETPADGGLRIGALVRNSTLAHDPAFARHYPAVAEALLSGASAQLRNAATTAGNVMQRTRCQYFYDPASACNKREPGAGCDARGGETRLHAILGWSEQCVATHPSDFCVPLVALDAMVEIEGTTGRREVALEAFHRLPGDTPHIETVLAPGELIVAVRLPPDAAGFAGHARYLKIRERTSYAFALVSAAACLKLDGGTITEARLALGGVALKPWRARAAEAVLTGRPANTDTWRAAAQAALADATPVGGTHGSTPPSGNSYKIDLARRVVMRALALAAAGTPERLPALPGSAFAPINGELLDV